MPDVPIVLSARSAAVVEALPVPVTRPELVTAPAKLPGPILDRLNREMLRAIASPEARERLTGLGADPRSSSPAEMRAHVATEIDKWKRVVEMAKIERQ